MPSGPAYRSSLNWSIYNRRGVWLVFIGSILPGIPVFNANNVDPDQTSRSTVSDWGLNYLPVSL